MTIWKRRDAEFAKQGSIQNASAIFPRHFFNAMTQRFRFRPLRLSVLASWLPSLESSLTHLANAEGDQQRIRMHIDALQDANAKTQRRKDFDSDLCVLASLRLGVFLLVLLGEFSVPEALTQAEEVLA